MRRKRLPRYLSGLLAIVFALGVTACADVPPHGPHAHYHPYDYYYYPSVGIYFRYSTGYYYYPSGTVWIKTRQLPPRYRLDEHDRVVIHIENDKPYERHHQHEEKYRPRPDYRPDPYRDEKERYFNQKQYEDYRKRR
ncbi:hypothetical protein [Kaarinaea lacus]